MGPQRKAAVKKVIECNIQWCTLNTKACDLENTFHSPEHFHVCEYFIEMPTDLSVYIEFYPRNYEVDENIPFVLHVSKD